MLPLNSDEYKSVYILYIIRTRFFGNNRFKFLIKSLKLIKLHYNYFEVNN